MIFLYGAYGIGNLGDDLILLGALQHYDPNSVKIICYGRPAIDFEFDWIDERAFKTQKEAFLKQGDILVFAGGGLFWADVHIYEMLDLARYAKKVGAEVHMQKMGFQGLGLAPDAAKELCEIAELITVRDFNSIQIANEWQIDSNIIHSPDFVFSLSNYINGKQRMYRVGQKPRIGINHSNVCFYHDVQHREKTLNIYARLASDYGDKIDFVYIPQVRHHNVIDQNDVLYAEFFWQKTKGKIKTLNFPNTVDGLLNIYCELDAVIAWRYHALVLASVLDIPALLFADNSEDKYQAFAREYAVPHIDFNLNEEQILWAFHHWLDRFLQKYRKN